MTAGLEMTLAERSDRSQTEMGKRQKHRQLLERQESVLSNLTRRISQLDDIPLTAEIQISSNPVRHWNIEYRHVDYCGVE